VHISIPSTSQPKDEPPVGTPIPGNQTEVNKLRPRQQTPKRPTHTARLANNDISDGKRPTFHELISHRQLKSISQLPKPTLAHPENNLSSTHRKTISIFKTKSKPQIDVKMDSGLKKNKEEQKDEMKTTLYSYI
jgi:hypothetical protein